jgi:GAF domain-containing protein
MTSNYPDFDPRLLPAADAQTAAQRVARLRQLGLGTDPIPEFDDFARDLARDSGASYAFVNFVTDQQYLVGASARPDLGPPPRTVPLDRGFCPHVVDRGLPLVLGDICAMPRFGTNPVVNEMHARSYVGAPLIDRTGTVLGTICVIDTKRHDFGDQTLAFIKDRANVLMETINRREGQR